VPNDRTWLRDSAPTGVVDPSGAVTLLNWSFNAWAKYANFRVDAQVGRAIADLPERRRIAMTLRWKHDMSSLEIARVLGTTPEAVRTLLTRARADLASLLERARH